MAVDEELAALPAQTLARLAGLQPLRLQCLPLGLLQRGEVIVQAPLGAHKVLVRFEDSGSRRNGGEGHHHRPQPVACRVALRLPLGSSGIAALRRLPVGSRQLDVDTQLVAQLRLHALQQGCRNLAFHLLKVPEDSVEHALLLLWGMRPTLIMEWV